MNTSTSEALWPSPVSAHEQSLHSTDNQTIVIVAVADAIVTAVGTGAFTASVNVSTYASQDVQYVTALLNQGSYSATVTGSNLVINW